MAATWAAMIAMGAKVCLFFRVFAFFANSKQGYRSHAENIYRCAQKIREGVAKIPGLFVYGNPPAMVVAWGSNEVTCLKGNMAVMVTGVIDVFFGCLVVLWLISRVFCF